MGEPNRHFFRVVGVVVKPKNLPQVGAIAQADVQLRRATIGKHMAEIGFKQRQSLGCKPFAWQSQHVLLYVLGKQRRQFAYGQ